MVKKFTREELENDVISFMKKHDVFMAKPIDSLHDIY